MGLQKIVVLGVGNILLQDEGVGIHVIQALQKMSLPENVDVIEGGTAGLELLPLIEDYSHMIVVDAVNAGEKPGTLFRFKPDDVTGFPGNIETSVHQLGLLEVLQMGKLIGKLPDTVIIAVQPKSFDWGMELTPELQAKMPQIIDLVFKEIEKINK
ncbi:HyaD/HybD family hydrogenase maturation endopeptidase [Thermincola potens]|uniref:HyaD/HybD family hydrogenase maturation endopeptidase n=1 Tax=Thermincola potens TaxID=863643 RepID=UPI0005A26046|nr:HyaD/HybD family hydrogenase maturation endopeptidase [Thermincola potens]